jgi:hypothetical protein
MKIRVSLGIGYPTAVQKGVIEVDDDATDEQIDEEVGLWANNYVEISWTKV